MSQTHGTQSEQWRPVVGYEGLYEVSDLGRVRSVDRWVRSTFGSKQLRRGIVLTPNTSGPYPTHKLSGDGRQKTHRVHRLVLEAFVGPRPEGMEARHFPDHSHANNRLDNLSWGTKKQNAADKEVQGQSQKGEMGNNAKLRDADIIHIRKPYASGKTSQEKLAARYGVSQAQIWRIVRRTRWAHI
jgi:hypothetical protein